VGQTLTSEEIVSHATGKAITGKIKFQARSCDDILCDGETFKGPTSETDYYETSVGENLNVEANKYFQYKAYFETSNASYSPEMYNVSIEGRNFALDTAWIDWDGVNYTMEGSGLSWQKT